ncbi:MAG: SCP2 sterol-binding domain-containing protein [Acidimicrobiia bacterium]|nr:SCP2 sterol-binding domain-containing protein [Acidimicrobiia bacterium]
MNTTFDPASIPLPSSLELLRRSKWTDEIPGLREESEGLLAAAEAKRVRAESTAHRLARPQIDAMMVTAMARIGGRTGVIAAAELLATAVGGGRAGSSHRGGDRMIQRAEQLVRAGGPAWVKLGQFVATAGGLLPEDWVETFAWCRDEVPPFPAEVARERVQHHLHRPVGTLFSDFEDTPLAAASIAQVHTATLPDGRDVVVKIRRPGLRRRFFSDIRAMAGAAHVAERVSSVARTGNVSGFVELFARLVLEELDFGLEAANMVELGLTAEHAGADYVRFPRPIPGMVSDAVLVMERVPGTAYTVTDLSAVDRERLLRLAIQGVLEQTLVYGVFHGDLHAGNVLLDEEGTFSLVDFGIVGRLDKAQRAALVRFLVGFVRNDIRDELEAMVTFGAIPARADLDAIAADIEAEVDPGSLGTDAPTTALAAAVGRLIRVVAHRGFRLPKELVLFFKNLLYLNGFANAVAPDSNLLAQVDPVFQYFDSKYGRAIPLFLGSDGTPSENPDEAEGPVAGGSLTSQDLTTGLTERAVLAQLLRGRSDDELYELAAAIGMPTLMQMVIEALVARFQAERATGQEAVIRWDVADATGVRHSFVITVDEGSCAGSVDVAGDPRLTLGMTVPVFLRFLAGQVDSMQAFMEGDFEVTGDLPFAVSFQSWFRED